MSTFSQDLRYSARMLLKRPGFTAVAALTLALGIGANSAIFSVVDAVLLRPLPYDRPDRLVILNETFPQGTGSVSAPNYEDWRRQSDVFEAIAAYSFGNFSLLGADAPERVPGTYVTPNFFEVLGARPRLGRAFAPDEAEPGRERVAVVSDRFWRTKLGADADAVGRDVTLGGERFTVVGVMPPEVRFPSRLGDLWVPLVFDEAQRVSRGSHQFSTVARLKPGVSVEKAQEQMSVIARILEQEYPEEQAERGVLVTPLQEAYVARVRPALLTLLGTVGFVLLIACINVANLLLARAASRRKEVAIRSAIGAGRGRLVRQFLTESVLLALLGGVLGLALARLGVGALVALAQGVVPRSDEIALDGRVLAFTLAVSAMTGVAFGLAPALQLARQDLQEALKEGGGAGEGPRRNLLRSLLVVGEVAAALVLLVGAGLLVNSFLRLQGLDAGLRPEGVLTARVSLPDAKYAGDEAVERFYAELLGRAAALPGVESVGVTSHMPLAEYGSNGPVWIEGKEASPPGQEPLLEVRTVSNGYFQALRIPLLEGRLFERRDFGEGAPLVAVVNRAFVDELIPGEAALGRRFRAGGEVWIEVVGVVGDVRQPGLTRGPRPEAYFAVEQVGASSRTRSMSIVARTAGDPASLAPALRAAVGAVDPTLPIYAVRPMEEVLDDSISQSRLNVWLMGGFAALAGLLALVGIYSVMSYVVAQSTRELGIRVALGARPSDIFGLVVGHGLVLATAGVVVGLAGAFGLTRLMESMLFGVTPTDPATFAAVAALLVAVAALACFVPARRATRVDPMVALRSE